LGAGSIGVVRLVGQQTGKLYRYRIAGKFGRAKFGKFTRFEHSVKKVWQMNRFSQKVIIVRVEIWMVLVWRIKNDSPNFLPAKLSSYTVSHYNSTNAF